MNFKNCLAFILVSVICGISRAQVPDVSITTELRLIFFKTENRFALKSYDPMGRFSTITLSMALENGLWVRASQRFSRFDRDAAESLLDASFIEAPGLWRVGYLDLNFGAKHLIRDYGTGGELRSNLLFDQLPFTLAVVDSGDNKPKGIVARLGSRIGVSIAKGRNFAAGGSSLNVLRDPEDAPGQNAGYKLIYGADAAFTLGATKWNVEYVGLRDGIRPQDKDLNIADVTVKFFGVEEKSDLLVGLTQEFQHRKSYFRLEANIDLAEKVRLYAIFKQFDKQGRFGIGTVIKF